MRMPGTLKEFAMSQSPSVPRDASLEYATLEQLKRQAKRLLKSYKDGSAEAIAQFSQHPRQVSPDDAQLTDAQLVLARAFGLDSWPRLRRDVLGRQLRMAIWDHDLNAVRGTLDEDPEIIHDDGPHPRWGGRPTPLQLAAERGHVDIVRLLLDRGADPTDKLDGYGDPMQLAAHWQRIEVVDVLREHGTALDIFSAALLGKGDVVAELLSGDANLATAVGMNGAPPLHAATTPEVAHLLVDHGASLDTIDSMGNTPLASAIGRGQQGTGVALSLLQLGASATPCALAGLGQSEQLLEELEDNPGSVEFVGNIGLNAVRGTPLLAAVHAGKEQTVRTLLAKGADVKARADMGQTSLHLTGSAAIGQLLLDAGADPSAVDDEHGTTPLTWAQVTIDIRGETAERRELLELLEALEKN
jgi:ankyrin repeat protein